ncbi:MAG TPA: class I SAM-dependent methyltransferase [Puia sp.]|jgi:ubiquinone/menaquinone biosynthesis C-methylase UbiE|nr:class I SAM-dependent methyltransferase [Puia sp.]
MELLDKKNEMEAGLAFSRQSVVFDGYDAGNTIIQYKRKRVREHVLRHMPASGSILELNSGTGEDAGFFGGLGYRVHATDISEGMQQQLKEKMMRQGLTDQVTAELCSFNSLGDLKEKGPYDCIFSNFAGLNCTNRLDEVLASLAPLVKPGGQVTLVILPGFSLWETLLVFKGKFRTAFRRWWSSGGAKSHVEGVHFKCWYYSPSYVVRHLAPEFDLMDLEGLCTFVPPSYIEHFAEKRPVLYRWLCGVEDRLRSKWPWRSIGDYYIISFRKCSI